MCLLQPLQVDRFAFELHAHRHFQRDPNPPAARLLLRWQDSPLIDCFAQGHTYQYYPEAMGRQLVARPSNAARRLDRSRRGEGAGVTICLLGEARA